MGRGRHSRPIILDWFYVTYRSLWLTAFGVVLALAAAGAWWYHATVIRPQAAALAEIEEATRWLAEAGRTTGSEPVEQVKASAREALDEARGQFVAESYDDARLSAVRARQLALRALEMQGNDVPSGSVMFTRIRGDVRVKPAGEFAWVPAHERMKLEVGDQVKTAKNGSASLLYFDGTETVIDGGSLLEIRDLFEDPVTEVRRVHENLKAGSIEARTQKGNERGSYHEFATDNVRARATGAGDYRVVQRHDGPTEISAFGGAPLEVATDNKKVSLGAGERIVANLGGSLSAKEMLPAPPRLVSPQDQKVFPAEDPAKAELALSWEAVPGISRYRLVIAADRLFAEPLYNAERTGTSATIAGTGVGEYYWRVASLSGAGNQSRFSETRRFSVTSQRIRDRADTEPPVLEVTEAVLSGSMLIVSGRTEPGATLWIDSERNEVDDRGQFSAVIRLRREGWNEITVLAQDAAGNETRVRERAYVETF